MCCNFFAVAVVVLPVAEKSFIAICLEMFRSAVQRYQLISNIQRNTTTAATTATAVLRQQTTRTAATRANTAVAKRTIHSDNFKQATANMSAEPAAATTTATPIHEQGIVAMKKYLDEYGVSYKDCVEVSGDREIGFAASAAFSGGDSHADHIHSLVFLSEQKSEIVQRVKDTVANPPAKPAPKPAVEEGVVGKQIVSLLGDKLQFKSSKFSTSALKAKVVALYFSAQSDTHQHTQLAELSYK